MSTVLLSQGCIHKCVETIEEIPKLKLFTGQDKKRIRAPCEFLQEFQYGNDIVQTTTNKSIIKE